MTLKFLKDWIESLPVEFLEFNLVNAEISQLGEGYYIRLDKPVIKLDVDEDNKEILFLNETIQD